MPGPGRTIWGCVEKWATPLSLAFHALIMSAEEKKLQSAIANKYNLTYNPLPPVGDGFFLQPEKAVKLSSSALLSIWMLSRVLCRNENVLSLYNAEKWFLKGMRENFRGVASVDGWPEDKCIQPLLSLSYDDDFRDLFPYILETFEMSPNLLQTYSDDFVNKGKRTYSHLMKRRYGMFYTPSDVSEYIVNQMISSWNRSNGKTHCGSLNITCLDPACGTGVFLLAALRGIRYHHSHTSQQGSLHTAVHSLYGMDISCQAIQSAAFVILLECAKDVIDKKLSFWSAWQAIRGNFAVIDSTLVQGTGTSYSQKKKDSQDLRTMIRETLLDRDVDINVLYRYLKYRKRNKHLKLNNLFLDIRLGDIFEEMCEGFTFVIGNPPYSKIPHDQWNEKRRRIFISMPDKNTIGAANTYPLFVEMMWRFTKHDPARGGMIVPLSIAYSSGKPLKTLRYAIQNIKGEWTFYFFDRTPDSIFGDNIKTRNAIVFFRRDEDSQSIINTSSFLRWTSRNRVSLFENLRAQTLDSISIENFIPKIGTGIEMATYKLLLSKREKVRKWWKSLPASALLPNYNTRHIFYYSTAYNWLPIFRSIPTLKNTNGVIVPKSIRRMIFESERNARFFFAVASSRLAYWLWRVEGDGFHLTSNFMARLPFHPSLFSSGNVHELENLAEALWVKLRQYPIVGVNSSQTTINYCPYKCGDVLDKIDSIIVNAYGIDYGFLTFLKEFIVNNIIVGRENETKYKPILSLLSDAGVIE